MRPFTMLALISIIALGICAQSYAGNVNLRLGPEGDILGWLVIGPFPNEADKEFKDCKGFETDNIGETDADPVEGQKAASAKWRLAVADAKMGLDFVRIMKSDRAAVAYAYANVSSKSARDARLLLGSDDGVKVWVNGRLVHTNHVTRGVEGTTDQVDIQLNPGANRLLFKVDQHFGGWGLRVKVANRDGSRADGITEILAVGEANSTSLADTLVRASAGKQGSLDTEAARRYEAVIHKIRIWMTWFKEYSPIDLPLRTGQASWASKVGAAQAAPNADVLSSTLREAALDLEGRFDAAFGALQAMIQNPKPLMETKAGKEDYVRVAPGGRYFVHPDGSFFIPLGYNHNPDWDKLWQCAPGRDDDPEVTERFFKHLHESGVNVIRMMIETPGGNDLLENPVGTFKVEQVAWLDTLFRLARKYDIKLMITPWDTFWMNHRWDDNPYNVKNGGLVDKKVDFLTKREIIEAQKKRWKFVIDRWGNTGTVFAWELFNEIDLWWGASPEQIQAWVAEMGDYVRTYERQKWGRNHVITVSIANPFPKDGLDVVAFSQPENEVANTHLYIGAANAPDEAIGPAKAEREGVMYAMDRIKDNRPYIDTEDGPINRWIADEKLDDEVFHNMSWAHLASGGAGSGMRWPYRNPHHLSEGMYQHLGRMSKFVKDVPWQKLTGTRSEIKVTVPEGWVTCSTGTSEGAIVWVASPKPSEMKLVLSWNGPGTVKYRCYDTKSGEWIGKGTAKPVNGELSIPVSGERVSVAIILD